MIEEHNATSFQLVQSSGAPRCVAALLIGADSCLIAYRVERGTQCHVITTGPVVRRARLRGCTTD
ncbi:hypothetical protein J6590_088947 [Homalodisca vitripennis]|nr:hypothetical protein J6590_088947 [Homalodisca vitripennis]